MLNNYTLNTVTYGGILIPTKSESQSSTIAFSFGGFDFFDQHLINIFHESTPQRRFKYALVTGSNGGVATGDGWSVQKIKIGGRLRANTAIQLQKKIRETKRGLQGANQILSINHNGKKFICTATWINADTAFKEMPSSAVTFIDYVFEFVVLDPFKKKPLPKNILFFADKSPVLHFNAENNGDVPTKLDILIIIRDATNAQQLKITNTTNGDQMTINTTIETGDILRINGEQTKVTVRNDKLIFGGVFPLLEVGTNKLKIELDAEDATFDTTVSFFERIL